MGRSHARWSRPVGLPDASSCRCNLTARVLAGLLLGLVAGKPLPAQELEEVRPLVGPPGLTSALWAGERMLVNPVAIAIDSTGRWYVKESDQLVRLEDTNGDGTADRCERVTLGFELPSDEMAGGVATHGGQVWLAGRTGLWKLTPASVPGVAADVEQVLRRSDVHPGAPDPGVSGITWGPDGRWYVVTGQGGTYSVVSDGTTIDLAESGTVLSGRPDGRGVEVVATGLHSPRDLGFDDFGNLFTADGGGGTGGGARLVYLLDGSDSGWRAGQTEPLARAGAHFGTDRRRDLAFPLPATGVIPGGPHGLAFHPGPGLAANYRGTLFIAHVSDDPAETGVYTYRLKSEGAGWAVARTEPFMRGVLPTDVSFGWDGRLYFSDWVSRWPWPRSGRGRIYAVDTLEPAGDDSAVRAPREWLGEGMSDRAPEILEEWLGHPDRRMRQAAQFELAERGELSLPRLRRVAEDPRSPRLARVHALWGAGQLADRVPGALNHFPPLLQDEDVEIRAQAAKLIGDQHRFEFFRFLLPALQDPSPRVALMAAQSLGKLQRPEAIPPLLEVLRRHDNRDPVLRHAVVIALARLGPDAALERSIHDSSRAVRLGGLLAYRRLGDPAVAAFLADFDPDLVREAAAAIYDLPIEAALPALAAVLERAPLDDAGLVGRAMHAHFRLGQPENAAALATFAGRSYVPASWRAEALQCLAAWESPPSRDRLTGLHRPLPARDPRPAREALVDFLAALSGQAPEEVQVAAIQAVAALRVAGTGHALWDVVFQTAHPVAARVAALQALAQVRDLRLEVAAQHAIRSEDAALRAAAVPIVAGFDAAVALPLLRRLVANGTTADLQIVLPLLALFPDAGADAILLEAMGRLQSGRWPLPAAPELIDAARARASPVLSRLADEYEAENAGADRLAPYRGALEGGQPAVGRRLFERDPRLACVRCHEPGTESGPERFSLAERGSARAGERMLEAILFPTAELAGAEGQPRHHQRCRMPEGVGATLSRTELRDLVAYLRGL
jgi:quinoprotein glucose dehydrogenase